MSGTEGMLATGPHLKMDQYVMLMCPVLAGNMVRNLMMIYTTPPLVVAGPTVQMVHPNVPPAVVTRNI